MSHKILGNVILKTINKNDIAKCKTSMLVILVNKNTKNNPYFKSLDTASKGYISSSIEKKISDSGKSLLLPKIKNIAAENILLVKDFEPKDELHKWLSNYQKICAIANAEKCSSITFLSQNHVPEGKDYLWLLETIAKSIESNSYIFSETKNKTALKPSIKKLEIVAVDSSDFSSVKMRNALNKGFAIGEGVNAAKYLGDLPANHCTPKIIEKKVKALKKEFSNLKISTFNEKDLLKLKMGSFLSVGKGSDEPPRMMVIEYYGKKSKDKPIVLVGKGITFDTGGISIKPSPAMDEMKWDMCGAASVYGVMTMLARLKANVNVVGVMACAENMPSGRTTKPGDVVTSMSGQTIEILNTDAEGRLVLCDALTYIRKYKPSYVIDMATLTGAVVVALGRHASGVMSNNQFLADKIIESGENVGDRAWQLPLWDEYMSCTKTNFADIANIGGGREAGTITAAAFLSKFTEDYKWAHIDIAASAWYSSPHKGGTGRPVPLISELILSNKLK